MSMSPHPFVTALVGAVVLAGCAGGGHECGAVGAASGLFVTGGGQGGVLTLCAEKDCQSIQTGLGARFVEVPSLHVGRQSLRATYKFGQTVVDSEVAVEASKRQPNGPDCEPTVAVANVAVRPDGHVLQVTK